MYSSVQFCINVLVGDLIKVAQIVLKCINMYTKALSKPLEYALQHNRRKNHASKENIARRRKNPESMVLYNSRPAQTYPSANRSRNKTTWSRNHPENLPKRNPESGDDNGKMDKHP